MMAGETPTIFGDGLTSRDFNYIDNAVSANLLACLAPSEVATGRVFNIGTGRSHTLNEVYAAIAEQLGFTAKPIYGPDRPGDIKHSLADITRATTELGYQAPKPTSTKASGRPSPGTSKKKKNTALPSSRHSHF